MTLYDGIESLEEFLSTLFIPSFRSLILTTKRFKIGSVHLFYAKFSKHLIPFLSKSLPCGYLTDISRHYNCSAALMSAAVIGVKSQ